MWGFVIRWGARLVPLLKSNCQTLVATVAGFFIGLALTQNHYEGVLKDVETENLKVAHDAQEKFNVRLAEAYDELERIKHDNSDLRASLDRVRDAYRRSQANAKSDTKGVESDELRECERLLYESTQLLGEGGELLQEINAKRDALIKVVQ